jgi:hypothetical protein
MRGTRRRQACERQSAIGKMWPHVAVETALGFRAVEEHVLHPWMGIEERGEIVWHDRRFVDGDIQAAFPDAGSHDIPKGQADALQGQYPLPVSKRGPCIKQRAHDRPERILRVGVIAASQQRRCARHAAQHEYSRCAIFNRGETADCRDCAHWNQSLGSYAFHFPAANTGTRFQASGLSNSRPGVLTPLTAGLPNELRGPPGRLCKFHEATAATTPHMASAIGTAWLELPCGCFTNAPAAAPGRKTPTATSASFTKESASIMILASGNASACNVASTPAMDQSASADRTM